MAVHRRAISWSLCALPPAVILDVDPLEVPRAFLSASIMSAMRLVFSAVWIVAWPIWMKALIAKNVSAVLAAAPRPISAPEF